MNCDIKSTEILNIVDVENSIGINMAVIISNTTVVQMMSIKS